MKAVIVAALAALVLAACDQVTGGGYIPPDDQFQGKASFGFSAKCRNIEIEGPTGPMPAAAFYEGQFEWYDHAMEVRLHGDVDPIDPLGDDDDTFAIQPGTTCQQAHEDSGVAFFAGEYRPQPRGVPGRFDVQVNDGGKPNSIDGDHICLELTGGQYGGYRRCGFVQGGNVQIK